MKNLTVTICLSIAVLLGSAETLANYEKGPATTPNVVAEKSKFGLKVSFINPEFVLYSDPNSKNGPVRVVRQAIGKTAILLKQNKSWIKIRFEGEELWVHSSNLDKNLKPTHFQVLFKVSDVTLRSGPSTQFPTTKVLKDARFRPAVPFEESGDWLHIVFDKRPHWVHSNLVQRHEWISKKRPPQSAHRQANQLTFYQFQEKEAAAGDPKAMKQLGLLYGWFEKIHLEMSYMWLSLAMDNASTKDKAFIRRQLDEEIIPELRDFDIATAERRMKRCKESNYKNCGATALDPFSSNFK